MSILAQLVQERQSWCSRYKEELERHRHIKSFVEYSLMAIAVVFLYFFHARVFDFLKGVLH